MDNNTNPNFSHGDNNVSNNVPVQEGMTPNNQHYQTPPVNQPMPSEPVSKPKKPIYKKWWFWLIIVIIVIACFAVATGGNKAEKVGETGTSSESSSSGEQTQNTSTDSSSQEQEIFKVGDVINSNKSEYTITSVDRNFVSSNELVTPNDGYEYVKVNFKLKNLDSKDAQYYPSDWEIIDADGAAISYSLTASAIEPDVMSYDTKLTPNGQKTVSLVFEVPAGSENLVLRNKKTYSDGENFRVQL